MGQHQQAGNTRTMIFSVTKVVSYLSRFMTLELGDVVTLGIEKPGDQKQAVFAWHPALIGG